MRRVPLAPDIDAAIIARGTLVSPVLTGELVNEAALFAARGNKRVVSMVEFEKAKDKIMMGAERRSMVMTEAQKESTAYHEAGHAIIGRPGAGARSGAQSDDYPTRSCAGCDFLLA